MREGVDRSWYNCGAWAAPRAQRIAALASLAAQAALAFRRTGLPMPKAP